MKKGNRLQNKVICTGNQRYFRSLIHTLRYVPYALFTMLLALCIFSLDADARVKGRCKDCHNVRGGHAGEPSISSVENDCLECHGRNPSGTENINTVGKSRFPQILHHRQNNDLAAGNFYYVDDNFSPDYSKGHNVVGISRQQNPPMDVPPGFMRNVVIPGGTGPAYWPNQKQLNCSGTWGCHGNRTIEDPYKSIMGAHHEDDSTIDGSTVGRSYRFLYGIKGKEHLNWEYLATSDNHNGYKGVIDADSMDTISYLCGECHAKFHPNPRLGGKDEVGQPYDKGFWHRHPTDIAFNAVRGGFANSEYQGYVRYSLQAPVACDKPTGKEEAVDSSSVVMCLSCHRAHASPYPSMLRWDYSNMTAGKSKSGGGCLTCHTDKGHH
jgi:predicted CXXCH cytochrome family protein